MAKNREFVNQKAKETAKQHLGEYLKFIGHPYNENNMLRCICKGHADEHPSMKFNPDSGTVYCFACNWSGDLIDVIAEVEGYEPKSAEAIKRAIEWAGTEYLIDAPRGAGKRASAKTIEPPKKESRPQTDVDRSNGEVDTPTEPSAIIDDALPDASVLNQDPDDETVAKQRAANKFIRSCPPISEHPEYAEYLMQARGFSAEEVKTLAERFHLRCNPYKQCLIIPHENGLASTYYTARPTFDCDKSERFHFNPSSKAQLFNPAAMHNDFFAVCEGAIDAMTLECCGIPAVGLPGAQNQKLLLAAIKQLKHRPGILICFDNDVSGRKAADKLARKLVDQNLALVVEAYPPERFNDMNDAFVYQRAELFEYLQTKKDLVIAALANPAAYETPFGDIVDSDPRIERYSDSIIKKHETSDLTIAKRFVDYAGNVVRFNTDASSFMYYSAPVWQTFNKDAELRFAVSDFRQHLEESERRVDKAVVGSLHSLNKVNKIIGMLYGFKNLRIPSEQLNSQSMLLNCRNGVVDLTSGKLLPHDPKYLWTKCASFDFDPDASSDIWNHFIESVIPDEQSRIALQRFLGYCLTGDIREEKALFVVGSGGNGKGTLFKTVMNILGDFSTPFKVDALLAGRRSPDANAASPELSKLEHTRLAVAEEVPKDGTLDNAQFKLLTGGDQLPIRRLHHEATLIKNPSHKLILCGNSLPRLSDPRDRGFLRRLIVIRFEKSFTDANCDPLLKQKLNQPEVKSAIFNWLLQGCLEWQRHGLLVSKAMQFERKQYLADNDLLADFIEEYCEIDKNSYCKRKDFIEAVRRHAAYSLRNLTDKEICKLLLDIGGIEKKRTEQGIVFRGIRLLNEEELNRAPNVDIEYEPADVELVSSSDFINSPSKPKRKSQPDNTAEETSKQPTEHADDRSVDRDEASESADDTAIDSGETTSTAETIPQSEPSQTDNQNLPADICHRIIFDNDDDAVQSIQSTLESFCERGKCVDTYKREEFVKSLDPRILAAPAVKHHKSLRAKLQSLFKVCGMIATRKSQKPLD